MNLIDLSDRPEHKPCRRLSKGCGSWGVFFSTTQEMTTLKTDTKIDPPLKVEILVRQDQAGSAELGGEYKDAVLGAPQGWVIRVSVLA
ncbi:MAG: hypothetical protein WCC32_13105, partial [Terriglobales bacterium]